MPGPATPRPIPTPGLNLSLLVTMPARALQPEVETLADRLVTALQGWEPLSPNGETGSVRVRRRLVPPRPATEHRAPRTTAGQDIPNVAGSGEETFQAAPPGARRFRGLHLWTDGSV